MNLDFQILSSGIFVPEKIIYSSEIDEILNLKNGETFETYKIHKRHWASKEETTIFMAKKAIDMALKKTNLEMKDIDCVINAGCLVPQIIPSTSSLLLAEYNVNEKDCFDVDCTCLSFLKALEIAIYMMNAKKYNRVLIFSSELASYGLKKENEKTFSMFGDGAVCFILEKSNKNESNENNFELLSSLFQTFPDGGLYSNCKAGGTLTHPKYSEYNQDNYYFEMDGPKLYKIAYKNMKKLSSDLLNKAKIQNKDINYFVPHQASHQAIELIARSVDFQNAKIINIFSEYGNQVSASIPFALHALMNENQIKKNEKIILLGAAAGIILGGMIIEKK